SHQKYDREIESNVVKVTTDQDITPPAIPRGFVAVGGNKEAGLYWTANEESDFKGYHIYQDGVRITQAPITQFHRIVTRLNNGQSYFFSISAIDHSGNESAQTTPIEVIPDETLS